MLKFFTKNTQRDLLIPNLELIQADTFTPTMNAIAAGEISLGTDEVPTWLRVSQHPVASKAFWVRMFEIVFQGKHNHSNLSLDLITKKVTGKLSGPSIVMTFLPYQTGIKTGNLEAIAEIARQTLPAWKVIALGGGDIRLNGERVTNRSAEKLVKKIVTECSDKGQNVLILTTQMAHRSFSIPEITHVLLAYDGGESGSTIQRMSRVLTPDPKNINKTGIIISLSLNPNREDKFDGVVLETAANHAQRNPEKSMDEAMNEVLDVLKLWDTSQVKMEPVKKDTYMQELMGRKSVGRVIGAQADIRKLDGKTIQEILNSTVEYKRLKTTDGIPKELLVKKKIRDTDQQEGDDDLDDMIVQGNKIQKQKEKLEQLLKEKITAIVDNMGYIMSATNCKRVRDAIKTAIEDDEIRHDIECEFGISLKTIAKLIDQKVINIKLLEMMYDNKSTVC